MKFSYIGIFCFFFIFVLFSVQMTNTKRSHRRRYDNTNFPLDILNMGEGFLSEVYTSIEGTAVLTVLGLMTGKDEGIGSVKDETGEEVKCNFDSFKTYFASRYNFHEGTPAAKEEDKEVAKHFNAKKEVDIEEISKKEICDKLEEQAIFTGAESKKYRGDKKKHNEYLHHYVSIVKSKEEHGCNKKEEKKEEEPGLIDKLKAFFSQKYSFSSAFHAGIDLIKVIFQCNKTTMIAVITGIAIVKILEAIVTVLTAGMYKLGKFIYLAIKALVAIGQMIYYAYNNQMSSAAKSYGQIIALFIQIHAVLVGMKKRRKAFKRLVNNY